VWVWTDDQRPDAKKDLQPGDVQWRYWSYVAPNGKTIRRCVMRFMEAAEGTEKEKRPKDWKEYRTQPIVDAKRELMVVHWVIPEDNRNNTNKKKANDNNNNNQRTKKLRVSPQAESYSAPLVDKCDIRLKTDIKILLGGALAKISRMQAVSFIYKQDPRSEETLGFIAQELQEIEPRLVTEKDGILMIKPTALIAILAQGVQELVAVQAQQQKQIDNLTKRTETLEIKTTEIHKTVEHNYLELKEDVKVIRAQLTPPTPRAFEIPTNIPEFDQKVLRVLRDATSPICAKQIAAKTSGSRKEVNQALYQRLRNYVEMLTEEGIAEPKWKLK